MAHLITGYAGYSHIKSADEGSFNASFFGVGQYVMESGNQFEGSIIDNNTVRILDGDGLMYGRHFRIEPNVYEDMTITTGTAGKNRIDLICMTYEKNADDETENVYLQVIKGAEAVGKPTVPEYINGNILEGASINQMPLYKVTVEGVVLSKIERLFATVPSHEKIVTNLSNPNLLVNGDFQVWQRGESFINTWDTYTADRWKLMHVNAKTTTVEKSTDVPPNTAFVSSVKIVDATNENARFRQYLENHLKAGVTCTLSFYAKFENDFVIRTLVVDGGTQNSLNIKGCGEWKKYEWTFTCNSEVIGIEMLTNFVGTVYFTGIKLELGSLATPFVPLPYYDELVRCGVPDDASTFGYKVGLLIKEIWKNASPTSEFASQRLYTTEPLESYDYILIEPVGGGDSVWIKRETDKDGSISFAWARASNSFIAERYFSLADDYISFESAYQQSFKPQLLEAFVVNNRCKPNRIYGIKGVQ